MSVLQVCGTPDYFAPELVEIAQRPEMDGGSFKAMGEEQGNKSSAADKNREKSRDPSPLSPLRH